MKALVLLLCLSGSAAAQPFDLGFEDSLISSRPGRDRWYAPVEDYLSYNAEIHPGSAYQGERMLHITASVSKLAGEIRDAHSGLVSQTFDADPYKGQRIRFRVYAKRVSGDGEAKMLMVVRRADDRIYSYEEEIDPSKSKWKDYEIIGDIRPTASEITIRLQTHGECSLLFDSVTFETVDKSVMTEREKRWYYTMVEFYEGFTKRWVYEGEIRYINGTSRGGTIVMKNGIQYRFNNLYQSVIDRVNKRYDLERK